MKDAIETTAGRTDLIPAGVPGLVVALLAVAAVLLWLAARYLTTRHRERLPVYGVIGPRIVTATAAAWCGLQALGRWCELTGPWPLWLAALVTGAAIEGAAALYQRERRVISPRLGLALTALRGLALLILVVVLMQPVRVWTTDRHISRRVAVLVDDSESMHFVDRLWTTSEMLELGVQAGLVETRERPLASLGAVADWPARARPWTSVLVETNQAPAPLVKVLEEGVTRAQELQSQAAALAGRVKGDEDPEIADVLKRLQEQVRETLVPALAEAQKAAAARKLDAGMITRAADAAEAVAGMADVTRVRVDEMLWKGLAESRRQQIAQYCTTTRVALARSILTRAPKGGQALLDRLAGRYDLDLMRLGNGLEPLRIEQVKEKAAAGAAGGTNAAPRRDWAAIMGEGVAPTPQQKALRSLTDYPAGLERVLKETPSEELAGVLIVSDGRNNSEAGLDPVGQRLGLQGVPVCGVVVGGSRTPRDVSFAEVVAPESIYLGDRVRVRATVRASGAKGSKIRIRMTGATASGETVTNAALVDGEAVLDQAQLDIFTDDFSREIRLMHEPKVHGIRSYTLRADVLEGELFTTNNTWKVNVAVSDDRTNVLLVDDRPRWEFRYLRNLFFGRDKSVHLQYVLIRPDEVAGVENAKPLPPASAARKFGDAEAGSLPASREEWRKFDVIILGDLDAKTLTPAVLAEIRHCVSERGSLAVVIAGPRSMPQALDDEGLRELLPVRYKPRAGGALGSEVLLRSRLELTAAGKAHPVMQQSASYSENDVVWGEMPPITWRLPVEDVKPGAEVLAYAQPVDESPSDLSTVSAVTAAARLDDETGRRNRNALIVAQSYGRGQVLMLNFDQTWRLRYRVGDKLHHKFWGQVMRWGVGEKLRAGGEGLRLGTDKLVYTPQMAPRVLARVTDSNFVGVADAQLQVAVRFGEKEVARVTPAYRAGSHGMYEAALPACGEPGRYDVVLTRRDGGREERVETAFLVVTAERTAELSDVTATREALGALARWTGGRVVGADRAADLWDTFGEGRRVVKERHERSLWDQPWVLLSLIGLLTAEWVLRKRGGLT